MRIIESDIVGDVQEFAYGRNHHYLRLRDSDGNETTMIERGLVKYTCRHCSYVFFAESREANCCPRCSHRHLQAHWTRPQVSLVPEKESDFRFVLTANKEEKP